MPFIEQYLSAPPIGFVGQKADQSPYVAVSLTAQEDIAFGAPLAYGTAEHTVRLAGVTTFSGTVDDSAVKTNGPTLALTASGELGAAVKEGVYTVRAISTGNTARFTIEDPDGISVGVASGGTAFTSDHLNFTVTAGSAATGVGDDFTVTVVADNPGLNKVIGFAMRTQAQPADAVNKFLANDNVTVFKRGAIFLTVSEAVEAGQMVYVNLADGTISATDGNGKVNPLAAYFESNAVAGAVARVRLP